MGVIHGTASWPGALAVESCTYTASHGITPGVAILKIQPQAGPPDAFGDLVISDGLGRVVIPGCRLDAIKVDQDEAGAVWSLEIVDRRWRWKTLGAISGSYNQLDIHGKLYPWAIRAPSELAEICLAAMGEGGYELRLPPGIAYPGPLVSQPIANLVSGVNPPVIWDATPPAQALQQVAELFGCRVVYRLATDSTLVCPLGDGDGLPPGSVHKRSPALKDPETPDAVGVVGSPNRYQCRLALEAVGEEWDGSYRPIEFLSYAPLPVVKPGAAGLPQKSALEIANPALGVTWKITLDGSTIAVDCSSPSVPLSLTEIVQGINNAAAAPFANVTAASVPSALPNVAGPCVLVTGKKPGVAFDLSAETSPPPKTPPQSIDAYLVQDAVTPTPPQATGSWDNCAPPLFAGVRNTSRLTYFEAQALAQKSVFRVYRLTGADVSGKGPIFVPGYGTLARRQQVILQDTQVDQVKPQPLDGAIRNRAGLLFTVDFYNGYSRDKPAACYGVVSRHENNGVMYQALVGNDNTPTGSRVYTPFSVDPVLQQITFADYVFRIDGGVCREPSLVLQTAVNVRDPITNAPVCFTKFEPVPGAQGGAPPQVKKFPDIQAEVTSTYGPTNKLTGYALLDEEADLRADAYLAAMLRQYVSSESLTLEYNGIVPIDLDGAISQVTWSVGASGASTTASRNTEHEIYIPPYPARRRAEFLPPVQDDRRGFLEMGGDR